jgi:hypothetical protein
MDIVFGVINADNRAENIARHERGALCLTSLGFTLISN